MGHRGIGTSDIVSPIAVWDDYTSGADLAFWARFEQRWLVEVRADAGGRLVVFDHDDADAVVIDVALGGTPATLPLAGATVARLQRRVEQELGREPPTCRTSSVRASPPRRHAAGATDHTAPDGAARGAAPGRGLPSVR